MANVCACGCGELLPEGSTRQYKRGHKNRVTNPEVFTETPVAEVGVSDEPLEEISLTLEDAALATPDDPEPKEAPEYKPRTVIKVTASIRRDIEGKLAFGFGMLGQTWALMDPLCGSVLVDNGDKMAKKYTPLICQSPEVVKWITKSGNFMLWVDALVATWPVLQVIFAHHIAKTLSMELVNQNGNRPAPNEYVVQ